MSPGPIRRSSQVRTGASRWYPKPTPASTYPRLIGRHRPMNLRRPDGGAPATASRPAGGRPGRHATTTTERSRRPRARGPAATPTDSACQSGEGDHEGDHDDRPSHPTRRLDGEPVVDSIEERRAGPAWEASVSPRNPNPSAAVAVRSGPTKARTLARRNSGTLGIGTTTRASASTAKNRMTPVRAARPA